MHGKAEWFAHHNSGKEQEEVSEKNLNVKPKKAYVFFNNDIAMLLNGRKMLGIPENGQI